MNKTVTRVVAVAFGVLLVGKTLFVEHLFHTGDFGMAYIPDAVECLLAWLVVLIGVTALIVRRATPTSNVVNNHYYGNETDETETDETESDETETDETDER